MPADTGANGKEPSDGAVLVYDGDCPVCSAYVRYVRLRESVGGVTLVNARDGGKWVERVHRLGYDLDVGMVLFYGDASYHAADCLHMIAMLSSPVGWFNRLSGTLLSNHRAARVTYPVLRAGRNLLLRLLGRRRLGDKPTH